jgi:hypothetical protein
MTDKITWTKIKHDVNGNPRYVCHFLELTTEKDKEIAGNGLDRVSILYNLAVKRANRIGGRKYHTKSYGGGIVFQSYALDEIEAAIQRLKQDED